MRFLVVYGTYWRLCLRGRVGSPISAYHKALWVRVLDFSGTGNLDGVVFLRGFIWYCYLFMRE